LHIHDYFSAIADIDEFIEECLVPITPYLATIFEHLRDNSSAPGRVRAADIRHLLLVLPFLLHDLMACEVEDHNRKHPREEPVVDPSLELIEVVLQLLARYHLFRRRNPPKDEDDIKDMRTLAER
jgi:hypothetical protein